MSTLSKTNRPTWLMNTLIVLMMTGAFMASDLYVPSLPFIAKAFDTSRSLSQLTLSVFLAGFAVSQYLSGILSDRFGRKPVLIVGTLIFIAASTITLFTHRISVLLFARILQGLGIGACGALTRVILRDLYSGVELVKMISLVAIFIGITPAVAPMIGGYVQEYFGYDGNFFIMFCTGLALLALFAFVLPETNRNKTRESTRWPTLKKNHITLFTSPRFMLNCLCTGMSFSVIITYSTINPFLMQNVLGVSPAMFGDLTLLLASGLVIGMLANNRIAGKVASQKVVRAGAICLLLCGASLLITLYLGILNLAILVLPLMTATVGCALIFTNSAANAFQPFPKIAGTTGAVYGFGQIAISSVVGAIASHIHAQTQAGLGWIILCLGLIAFAASCYLVKHFAKGVV